MSESENLLKLTLVARRLTAASYHELVLIHTRGNILQKEIYNTQETKCY